MTPIGTNPVGPVGWRRGALVLSAALTLTSCGMLGGPDSGEKVAKKFVGALGGADVAAAAALTDDPDGASDVLRRTFDGLGEETDADFTVEHRPTTPHSRTAPTGTSAGAGRGAIRRRCHHHRRRVPARRLVRLGGQRTTPRRPGVAVHAGHRHPGGAGRQRHGVDGTADGHGGRRRVERARAHGPHPLGALLAKAVPGFETRAARPRCADRAGRADRPGDAAPGGRRTDPRGPRTNSRHPPVRPAAAAHRRYGR